MLTCPAVADPARYLLMPAPKQTRQLLESPHAPSDSPLEFHNWQPSHARPGSLLRNQIHESLEGINHAMSRLKRVLIVRKQPDWAPYSVLGRLELPASTCQHSMWALCHHNSRLKRLKLVCPAVVAAQCSKAYLLIAGRHGSAGQCQAAQRVMIPVGLHLVHEALPYAVGHGYCAPALIRHRLHHKGVPSHAGCMTSMPTPARCSGNKSAGQCWAAQGMMVLIGVNTLHQVCVMLSVIATALMISLSAACRIEIQHCSYYAVDHCASTCTILSMG